MGGTFSRQRVDLEAGLLEFQNAAGLSWTRPPYHPVAGGAKLRIPGLAAQPFWEESQLGAGRDGWPRALRLATEEIAAEFRALRFAAAVPGSSAWPRWLLMEEGRWVQEHCRWCPKTVQLLRSLPLCESALGYAYFSVLPPGARVGAHCGVSNAKLRAHLALVVPPGGASACGLEVDGRHRAWREGHLLAFDDSKLHQAWNAGGSERVVLLFDIWHPQLSPAEVERLRAHFPPLADVAAAGEAAPQASGVLASIGEALGSASGSLLGPATQRRSGPSYAAVWGRESLACLLLGHLSAGDLGRLACAGKQWRQVALSEPVWAALLQRDFLEQNAQSLVRYKALSPKLHRCTSKEYDVVLRIIMVGDSCTGKSSFLLRCIDGTFNDTYICTIGVDFKLMTVRHSGIVVKLQLWDTAGPERFRTITQSYYRAAHGVILMYDQSDRASFDDTVMWRQQVEKHAPAGMPVLLCANKCDLKAAVTCLEGKAMAEQLGASFAQTSCKTGEGVDRAMAMLLQHSVPFSYKEKERRGPAAPPLPPRRRRFALCASRCCMQ